MRLRILLALVLAPLLALATGHEHARYGALPPAVAAILARVDERHEKDLAADIALGKEAAKEVAKETKLSEDAEETARVQRIGDELAKIANQTMVKVTWGDSRLNAFHYEFHLLKGDEVNAFSLPGGFIYVYEGLVSFAETDDELAGVLAHEIAHASFRHVATLRREQSKFDVINIPLIVAAILSRSSEAMQITQGVGLLNQAVYSGWSLKAEASADYGGLQYMLASQYEPMGILTFMERLAFRDRSKPQIDWGIYQTHPPSADRARALIQHFKEAGVEIRRSKSSTSLRATVAPGEDNQVDVFFGKALVYSFMGEDALTRADQSAEALNAFFDSVPAMYEVELVGGTRVMGRYVELLEATPDDGDGYREKADAAFKAIKKLVFDLNYRLWPNHDRATADR
ncbi:MAG: M48 family metalloprotease [Fimbriimonadaceae bacterium]|nr:M48 family metalloprotease [Fimbriimonadaceae bacterium]QYK56745.1 MAG: M48 family metalloprotease [Fimbriimonadaceae bacterium]